MTSRRCDLHNGPTRARCHGYADSRKSAQAIGPAWRTPHPPINPSREVGEEATRGGGEGDDSELLREVEADPNLATHRGAVGEHRLGIRLPGQVSSSVLENWEVSAAEIRIAGSE